ncbi:g11027 [Coccomyxa elongata]
MNALLRNDDPWPNHGIQTMYEFGWDIGGMERSRYFGYSKDLYHFDHFLGQFRNAFGDLVDADSCEIGKSRAGTDDGTVEVDVTVKSSSTQQIIGFCFRMQLD